MAEEFPTKAPGVYDQYLQSLYEQGFTMEQAKKYLRDAGFTFGDAVFGAKWREAAKLIIYEVPIERLRGESFVPRAWMQELEWDMATPYHGIYEVTYIDRETGKVEIVTRSLGLQEMMTKEELEDIGALTLTEELDFYEQTVVSVRLRGVRHMKGAPYT